MPTMFSETSGNNSLFLQLYELSSKLFDFFRPGMNSCSITEEETTKAVRERYQSHNQNALHGSLADVIPGATADSNMHLTQTRQDVVPGGGQKQHDLKEVSNSKQELLLSVKNTSLTDTIGSHVENELHFQNSRNPTDPVLEMNRRKKKSKKKLLDSYSDGGIIYWNWNLFILSI